MPPITRLEELMDAITAAQSAFAAEQAAVPFLRVYRWRPVVAELPAIYNWLAPTSAEGLDTHHDRETLRITTRIALQHADSDAQMALLERLSDEFRRIWDAACKQHQPFGAFKARRQSMGTVWDEFNESPVLCIEFVTEFQINKLI